MPPTKRATVKKVIEREPVELPCDADTEPPTQIELLRQLRVPFPDAAIGKLPRKNKDGSYFYLDYVGHAAVTDRLLAVDPMWSWAPVAFDAAGAPLIYVESGNASMWISLRVCGVERLGVGIVAANAFEREKQLIGDAIRNAAMRFGVALDLWSKEDLRPQLEDAEWGNEQGDAPPTAPAWSVLGYDDEDTCRMALDEFRIAGGLMTDTQRTTFREWRTAAGIPWPIPAEHAETVRAHLAAEPF